MNNLDVGLDVYKRQAQQRAITVRQQQASRGMHQRVRERQGIISVSYTHLIKTDLAVIIII